MSLTVLNLPVSPRPLPPEAIALITEGYRRAEAFHERVDDQPPGGFLAGDYELAHSALEVLQESDVLAGPCFCEWGSGLGVIAGLAAQLGYRSFGIELQADLTEESRTWLGEQGLDVTFATGTYVPENLRHLFGSDGTHGTSSGLANPGPDGHAALGVGPDAFDLVYVYPPPSDEYTVLDLFDALARPGAILISYRGEDDVHLHRKDA